MINAYSSLVRCNSSYKKKKKSFLTIFLGIGTEMSTLMNNSPTQWTMLHHTHVDHNLGPSF